MNFTQELQKKLLKLSALALSCLMFLCGVLVLGVRNARASGSDFYDISNYAELVAFRDAVNLGQDFSTRTVRLTNNIDFGTNTWNQGIGNGTFPFNGTFFERYFAKSVAQ